MSHQNLHKELDLIQKVIERMARNSFLLKGWALSLVVIVPALMKDGFVGKSSLPIYGVLVVTVICFWYLDAWFLHKEKCYRELYDDVVKKRLAGDDTNLYSLNYQAFTKKVEGIGRIMLSPTLSAFYAVPGAVVVLLLLLNFK